mgnify:CR=1 FL=1
MPRAVESPPYRQLHGPGFGHWPLDAQAFKVVVHMLRSHLPHILQPLDSDPFLKAKAYARAHIRSLLTTLPRSSRFNLVPLRGMVMSGSFHCLSSVEIVNGFKETGP